MADQGTAAAELQEACERQRILLLAVLQAAKSGCGCAGAGKQCKPSLRTMGAWEAYPLTETRPYRPGTAVATVGHSLIGPGARLGPMVTFGCLSCAIEPPGGEGHNACAQQGAAGEVALPSERSMLMTDSLVHSGCSGGALVLMDEVRARCALPWPSPCHALYPVLRCVRHVLLGPV